MPSKLRSHLRSNVVGYVALFVALSGSAYAVNGPLAGRNTVGSADIINQEVKSADVEDDGVSGADIDESSLAKVPSAGSADSVADGAVTSAKFGTLTRQDASVVVPGGVAGNGSYATRDASVTCSPGLALGGSAFWTVGQDPDDELPLIETSYGHNGAGRPVSFRAEGGNDTSEDTMLVVAVHCLQP
jgi:hypothetical protein